MQQTSGEMTVIFIAMNFWCTERWLKITTWNPLFILRPLFLVTWCHIVGPGDISKWKKKLVHSMQPLWHKAQSRMCTSWSVVTSVASVEANDHYSCTTAGSGKTSLFLPIPSISIYQMSLTVDIQQLCSQLHCCHFLPMFP